MHGPFTPSGVRIETITSSPFEVFDANEDKWFIKPAGEQAAQIEFLANAGLPVPEMILIGDDPVSQMALKDAGKPINEYMGVDNQLTEDLIRTSGALLNLVHTALDNADPALLPEISPGAKPSTTADPLVNFVYRFIEAKSSATNQMAKNIPAEAKSLRDMVLELVATMREKGLPAYLADGEEPAYGDYKPENILYTPEKKGLSLIDPLIHRGRRISDVSKFCIRIALEPNAIDLGNTVPLKVFREGYESAAPKYEFVAKDYIWLASLDLANITSSYLGRLAKGDTRYRLVSKLANDPSYRTHVESVVADAISMFETFSKLKNNGATI